MRNVSGRIYRENQNTHFISVTFFSKNCAINEIMWKNMIEAYKLLMTIWRMCFEYYEGYRHTLRIFNTYCFYAAIMVTRKCLRDTLYVRRLSCLFCVYLYSLFYHLNPDAKYECMRVYVSPGLMYSNSALCPTVGGA